MTPAASPDQMMSFLLPDRDARGRIVRLGPVLDTILAAHADPLPLQHLLAEALVLTALLGSLLKDEAGQVTLQAQCEGGGVSMLVCDWQEGALRGYIRRSEHAAPAVAATGHLAETTPLQALVGRGYLAITFDGSAAGERYQGIVPMEGASLADAVEHYFAQSEQLPTCLRIATRAPETAAPPPDTPGSPATPTGWVAGGFLLQALPRGEAGGPRLHLANDDGPNPHWQHLAVMGGSILDAEMVDVVLPLDDLIWRLFHDEGRIQVLAPLSLTRGCRCDPAHIRSVLAGFPPEEQLDMADADGRITVDCAFCARQFHIEAHVPPPP